MSRTCRLLGLATAAFALLAGCLGPRPRLLPPDIVSVFVAEIGNRTGEPMLGQMVGDEMRRAFRMDGRLKVGDSVSGGCVLSGDVVEYGKRAIRYDAFNVVQEYRLRMSVDLALTGREDGRGLWRDRGSGSGASASIRRIEVEVDFVAVPASGIPVESEEDARRRLVRDLCRETVRGAVEGL